MATPAGVAVVTYQGSGREGLAMGKKTLVAAVAASHAHHNGRGFVDCAALDCAASLTTDYASYGWIITKDHLNGPGAEFEDSASDGTGTMGPQLIAPDIVRALEAGEGHTFYIYDDDRIKYYTGRCVSRGDVMDEAACYGPLGDYGAAWGAVAVEYHGHKEWDCG